MKSNKILSNIVLLRVFTILLVVLGHSVIFYDPSWTTFTPVFESKFFHNLKEYINVFQMPVFIFVSGYVYYFNKVERGKYTEFKSFLGNKFVRLMIPFFVVALLYVLPIRLFIDYLPYQGHSLISILFNQVLLSKDVGHLWYVQTLFNIFIIFYLLERYIKKYPRWLVMLFFLGLNIISVFAPNVFNLIATLRYLLYFYLGYYVRETLVTKGDKWEEMSTLPWFVLHFIGLAYSIIISGLEPNIILLGIGFALNSIGSVFSCFFYYSLFTKINVWLPNLYKNKTIKFLDKNSYGIYLFHSPLLYLVLYHIYDWNINPFLMVFLLFNVLLFGSLAITLFIEKTETLRFIIGRPVLKESKMLKVNK